MDFSLETYGRSSIKRNGSLQSASSQNSDAHCALIFSPCTNFTFSLISALDTTQGRVITNIDLVELIEVNLSIENGAR
jgi:hypothetical protein